MELYDAFSVWQKRTQEEQTLIERATVRRAASKGTLLHSGAADCVGLFMLQEGQLRAFLTSDEGKEVTLYRFFPRDMCLFSASCMMRNIQFDIMIEAEKDSEMWAIPADAYKNLMERSLVVSNYTNGQHI